MTGRPQDGQDERPDADGLRPGETDNLSSQEVEKLGARPGRGDRQVEGAHPSDEYVNDHVAAEADRPALDITDKS